MKLVGLVPLTCVLIVRCVLGQTDTDPAVNSVSDTDGSYVGSAPTGSENIATADAPFQGCVSTPDHVVTAQGECLRVVTAPTTGEGVTRAAARALCGRKGRPSVKFDDGIIQHFKIAMQKKNLAQLFVGLRKTQMVDDSGVTRTQFGMDLGDGDSSDAVVPTRLERLAFSSDAERDSPDMTLDAAVLAADGFIKPVAGDTPQQATGVLCQYPPSIRVMRQFAQGAKYTSHALASVQTDSLSECAISCNDNPVCEGFSYGVSAKQCYLLPEEPTVASQAGTYMSEPVDADYQVWAKKAYVDPTVALPDGGVVGSIEDRIA